MRTASWRNPTSAAADPARWSPADFPATATAVEFAPVAGPAEPAAVAGETDGG
ncbi:MAG: hypothetical protein U0075_13810 [Thermomicrobiales bacterium]